VFIQNSINNRRRMVTKVRVSHTNRGLDAK
jgi:hypothetical protein